MPDLDEFEEAERRQLSEHELFLVEDDDDMAIKKKNPAGTEKRKTSAQREAERSKKEKELNAQKTFIQNNSRAARAARRADRMEGVEVAPQQTSEPVSQTRDPSLQANAADEARRLDAALQEQIARDTDAQNERQAPIVADREMNDDAEIAAQLEAEMAAANERSSQAGRTSPNNVDRSSQEDPDQRLQAESSVSNVAQAQAPAHADDLRLQELEAENQALRNANEITNQERLNAVSERMAETIRADDAAAAAQQLTKQLSQTNSELNFAVAQAQALATSKAELELLSDNTIAMSKENLESANHARQEAEARASFLEATNKALIRERDDAVSSVEQRSQQLDQAKARNDALTSSLSEVRQSTSSRIAELERRNAEHVKTATQAALSATAEKANREKAESELTKRNGELSATKDSLAAEQHVRQQAEAKAAEFESKLKGANEATAREKSARETAANDAASQKKLVKELSGEGDKAKALETARLNAESKVSGLEDKLRSANESATREKAGRELAENASKSATEDTRRERATREAAENNLKELTAKNDQLATQVKEATQARIHAEERIKTMSERENLDSTSDLQKELAQERSARQAAEAKLPAATEHIARLEGDLKAARETADRDKPIPSIEEHDIGKDAGRTTTAAKEDEFGLEDISDADFDSAIAAAEAKQKEPAAARSNDDEFGLDDISVADFDAAVAGAEARQKEPAAAQKEGATAANAAKISRSPSAPVSREGSPSLDPAHAVKGNTWYRAGKMYVPEAQYDKMLRNGVKIDREVTNGQMQRVPLEKDKSAREVLLQAPNGDLHSPKAYKNAHGSAAFEARTKAEGLNPKIAANWPRKDQTRPEVLVKMKNGNLVDGKSLQIAAGTAGLALKFDEKNVFIENQTTNGRGGPENATGTGNYRRSDNAVERAWASGNVVSLNKRLEMTRVSPQPVDRAVRSATPTPNLNKSRASNATNGNTASPQTATRKIYRDGKVVASIPISGNNNSKDGGIKRLNNNHRSASAQPRPNNGTNARNQGPANQAPAPGYQRPEQGGAHNRQTSPTTTINLTVNGAVGHGTATPNVAASATPKTQYTSKLEDRVRARTPLGRAN